MYSNAELAYVANMTGRASGKTKILIEAVKKNKGYLIVGSRSMATYFRNQHKDLNVMSLEEAKKGRLQGFGHPLVFDATAVDEMMQQERNKFEVALRNQEEESMRRTHDMRERLQRWET